MNRRQAFLLLLLAGVSVLTFVIVLPFAEYVVGAGLLAYILHPAHRRLERRIGSVASAIAIIFGALIAIVLPLTYVLVVFIGKLRAVARGETGLDEAAIEARIAELSGFDVDVTELLTRGAEHVIEVLLGGVGGIVAGTVKAGLGLALVAFLLFSLLRRGPAFVGWLHDFVPLSERASDELFTRLDSMTWAVVVGHISVSVAQALLGGAGLWITGVPDPVFWTFVMILLALLPIIGTFLVWGPAALYLVLVVDRAVPGILLAAWGLTIVSFFDNYARPILIDRRARIDPGVILVGVVGGVYSIGFTGLFVGPIVIGVLAVTLEVFRTEYDTVVG